MDMSLEAMRRGRVLSIVALSACALQAQSRSLPSRDDGPPEVLDLAPDSPAYWRTARGCGTNALFLLLYGSGAEVSHDAVATAVSVGAAGSSLQDLVGAAARLGHPCEAYQATRAALDALEPPFVAHFLGGDGSDLGHYVVVVDVDREAGVIEALDGTLVVRQEFSYPEFLKRWSGAVLCRSRGGDPGLLRNLALWLLGLALGSGATLLWKGRVPVGHGGGV